MLFGSSTLEVLIGVLLLFLVLSVIASAVAEIVSQALALRSRTLHDAIASMLFDQGARDKVFAHPLIKSLSQQGVIDKLFRRIARPSYIPSAYFAKAVLDNVDVTREEDGTLVVAPRGDMCVPDELKTLITSLGAPLGELATDTEALGTEVAKWFDQSMDRVAGWYKRKTQLVLLAIGVVIVVWANANVIRYASALSVSSSAREIIVAAADSIVNPSASPETSASPAASTSPVSASQAPSATPAPSGSPVVGLTTDEALATLNQLGFAVGWDASAPPGDSRHLPARIEEIPSAVGSNLLGWLFTIAAVSMGAPFWFDALKGLINLRGAGAKPPSTQDAD